mmetsp:Transcript_33823/g.69141  ORF Transcript_33823/g.69141 Transcript_33823/m.69141 type:complete len:125 (-) Transcript_33823:367-741(-)
MQVLRPKEAPRAAEESGMIRQGHFFRFASPTRCSTMCCGRAPRHIKTTWAGGGNDCGDGSGSLAGAGLTVAFKDNATDDGCGEGSDEQEDGVEDGGASDAEREEETVDIVLIAAAEGDDDSDND